MAKMDGTKKIKCTCPSTDKLEFHEVGCPLAPATCALCGKPYTHKPQDCELVIDG